MPDLDGPETLAAMLRSAPRTAGIPVIFISASVQATEMAEYRKLDIAGVIVKPFDPMKLANDIRSMVSVITSASR